MPSVGDGLEIGFGTGRFAAPLGIRLGLERVEGVIENVRTMLSRTEGSPLADNAEEVKKYDERAAKFAKESENEQSPKRK